MGRTQRVDEKIGLICLVMFSPTFMIIKMSQMAFFFVFSADGTKKTPTVYAKY